MFSNLAVSIIEHEMIKTTLPKSKTLRKIIEPLITLAKIDSVHNRRLARAKLNGNAFAINKLFKIIGPKFKERPGGYTKILKCGFRPYYVYTPKFFVGIVKSAFTINSITIPFNC